MSVFNLSLKKQADRNPKVGIFWIINNDVVPFFKDVIPGEKMADSPQDHIYVWNRVLSAYPKLRGKDYDNVPRGRVTFINNTFNILVGKDWINNVLAEKIRRIFNLPLNKTKVILEEHYKTEQEDPLMSALMNQDGSFDDFDDDHPF